MREWTLDFLSLQLTRSNNGPGHILSRLIQDYRHIVNMFDRKDFSIPLEFDDFILAVLLSPPRDPNLLTRLWNPRKYPAARNKTKKFQSFVNYGLLHYH